MASGVYDGSRTLARQGVNMEEAKTLALGHLVMSGGNSQEARRRLKAQHGITVPHKTIGVWRDQDPLLYERMRTELSQRVTNELIDTITQNAIVASQAERKAIDRTDRTLGNTDDPVALSTVARNLAQIRTQAIDKTRLLEDKPTRITESRSTDEIVRQLVAMGVVELDEPEDAEVLEGSDEQTEEAT